MTDTATGSAEPQTSSGQPDYEAKYKGLQTAFNKRNAEIATRETEMATQMEELNAKLAKLAEYEARDAAEREEAEALAQYEQLQERFKTEPPPAQNPNVTNRAAWSDRYPRKEAEERSLNTGWPT